MRSQSIFDDEYFNLLEFISNYSFCGEEDKLFEYLESFLKNKFQMNPFLVYSYSKKDTPNNDKSISDNLRSVWNRDLAQKSYTKKELRHLLNTVRQNGVDKEKKWEELEIASKLYYIIYFGDDRHQSYIGIIRCEDDKKLSNQLIHYLMNFLTSAFSQIQNWKEMKRTNALVHIDDVTGLYNQRKLLKDLEEAIHKHNRIGEGFTVLFLDIDHFKYINDGYGHLIGTKILSELGKILKNILRESDLLYRYGGDEFVIIVPDASREEAQSIGERVLSAVKNQIFELDDLNTLRVSISIGISCFPHDAKSSKEILAMADRMMYCAKESGRGRVCMTDDFYK